MKIKYCVYFLSSLSLLSLACAKIEIAEIKFNHDTTSWSNDALNIRQNFTQIINVPEWNAGKTNPKDSPAAFVGGRSVKVMVKFKGSRDGVYEVYTQGGPFYLKKTSVQILNGVSSPAWISFETSNIPARVAVADVTWSWKRKLWWVFTQQFDTSYHRFYTVLDEPKEPWKQAPFPDSQNPWTEALDYACSWADGEGTFDGITGKVTEHINNGPYAYDQISGATHYGIYSPRQYNLTAFLDRLNGGWGNGSVVNCSDCGMSVTTFSNLLGCQLWSSRMGWGFSLNKIIAVGYSTFACPNWGCSFNYHEVAWMGNALASEPVFDACLKVDGDTDPANSPHTALLPKNIIFDDPSNIDYHERLVPPASLPNCLAQPSTKTRPPIF
ncbi:MAG: hypothetical protein B6D34_05280 [Candidatus Brocadia sp. UTAMX1]|jgi:hypothetical protein|nr:MAG: hypothetical protein B6D34_05280 [Candidatus Brocadia sp. UTAMX1]